MFYLSNQLTPPTPMTPASSASSTSQQMEKYKNARNKSPVGPTAAAAATTDSSGKLRRYEGYEKDLHKILNKASAKRTTAPLQPVKYALSNEK